MILVALLTASLGVFFTPSNISSLGWIYQIIVRARILFIRRLIMVSGLLPMCGQKGLGESGEVTSYYVISNDLIAPFAPVIDQVNTVHLIVFNAVVNDSVSRGIL